MTVAEAGNKYGNYCKIMQPNNHASVEETAPKHSNCCNHTKQLRSIKYSNTNQKDQIEPQCQLSAATLNKPATTENVIKHHYCATKPITVVSAAPAAWKLLQPNNNH